jgi:hypothetical protein
MGVMTGQMSKLDAAQAEAALHAQEYRDAISAIDQALANAQNLPEGFDKQSTIAGLNNQRSQATASYQIQSGQDAQAVASQQLGSGLGQTIAVMAQQWSDMTKQIEQAMTKGADSLNDAIARVATGGKGNWGKTFQGIGQSLFKTGLQGAEGSILKALHLGGKGTQKPAGTQNDRIFVSARIEGAGAADPGSGTSPANIPLPSGIMGSLLGKIPGLSASGMGGFLSAILPAFADGGDILANHPSIVGEQGPELFTPRSAGTITPNHALGGDTHTHFHIDARGSTDPAAVNAAIMRAAPHLIAASVQTQHSSAKRMPSGR